VPVAVPRAAEYVALGAARQAAWALAGGTEPPRWAVAAHPVTAEPNEKVRQAYGEIRAKAANLLT
jgi:xylulokinase